MRPISYELRGFPEFLRSESACRKAIERGDLQPETPIIAYGDAGGRDSMLARQHLLLRDMFPQDAAPAEIFVPPPPEPLASADPDPVATPIKTVEVATSPEAQFAVTDTSVPNSKPSSIKGVKNSEVIKAKVTEPRQPASGSGANVGCWTLAAIMVLLFLISKCDQTSNSSSTETAVSDDTSVTAVADTATLENGTDLAAATSSDGRLDAEMAPMTPPMPSDDNKADNCSEMGGFAKVICQSPELKSKDRQVRTAWYWAQRRMAQAAEGIEPLSRILGRIESCGSKSCALSAYAAEISKLENTLPQNAATVPVAEVAQSAEAKPRGNPGSWANGNDYPSRALQQEREGTTGFRVTIGTDGRVIDCSITQSSGHDDLDAATCTNVTRRARFAPAMRSGEPVQGSYSNRVRWQLPR